MFTKLLTQRLNKQRLFFAAWQSAYINPKVKVCNYITPKDINYRLFTQSIRVQNKFYLLRNWQIIKFINANIKFTIISATFSIVLKLYYLFSFFHYKTIYNNSLIFILYFLFFSFIVCIWEILYIYKHTKALNKIVLFFSFLFVLKSSKLSKMQALPVLNKTFYFLEKLCIPNQSH